MLPCRREEVPAGELVSTNEHFITASQRKTGAGGGLEGAIATGYGRPDMLFFLFLQLMFDQFVVLCML